jgi:hypothetical protein
MQMLYNSDSFVVVQFDLPSGQADAADLSRGGYEIVDKHTRKEIFIEGAVAERFKQGVQALVDAEGGASQDDLDDYIGSYTQLAQHPVVLH